MFFRFDVNCIGLWPNNVPALTSNGSNGAPPTTNHAKTKDGDKQQQEFSRKFVTYLDELWEFIYQCKSDRNVFMLFAIVEYTLQ